MQDKTNFINDAKALVNNSKNVLNITNIEDEQERQIFGAFLFGVINGMARETKEDPINVQGVMIEVLINDLNFTTNQAVEFCQYLIDCTDRENNPTIFSIIHRGLQGYYELKEGHKDKVKDNYAEITQLIKEASNESAYR